MEDDKDEQFDKNEKSEGEEGEENEEGGEEEESGSEDDQFSDLEESGSEDEAKVSPKKPKKSKKIVATKTKTIEKVENNTDKKELPFTFKVPKTSDDLEELFEGRNSKEKAIIIERMIKCNHPQFGKDNKAQLENLFAFLLQHIHDSASIEETDEDIEDNLASVQSLVPFLFDLAKF